MEVCRARYTNKAGVDTAVWVYEEAETVVVRHENVHISFFAPAFKDYAETIYAALSALNGESEMMPLKIVR